ncbi:MAG TPA: glycosyltransferase family 2 protein [bacterium]|nr:glycosyltransferase family 2 protein [bacterium]HPN44908.1 glycosyltransferase family 2 protein [bacterium]
MENTISVVIPAYNEENGIVAVVNDLNQVLSKTGFEYEIIIIDDGSRDKTVDKARTTNAVVVQHLKNRGYGAALKTGIQIAKNELILITDADNTYPADQIPKMLEYIKDADMVVGSRQGENVAIPLIRRPAKWMLRKLAEYVTGEHIPDLNSGLRIFRKELIMQYLNILSDRFSFTTTSTVAFLSDNYKVEYVPINYYQRAGKSKIVPWNFVEFMNLVIRLSMLFNPLKIFLPAALFTLAIGGIKFIFDVVYAFEEAGGFTLNFLTHKVVSSSVLILCFSGLQILLIGMMADGINRKIAQYSAPKAKSFSRQLIRVFSPNDKTDN